MGNWWCCSFKNYSYFTYSISFTNNWITLTWRNILLLYIVYKLYTVDVIKGSEKEEDINVDSSSFLKAIWTVLLADFTMSLDNVLGVAGDCRSSIMVYLFLDLVLSIALMATAATLISGWTKNIQMDCLDLVIAIVIVAVELIYTDIQILFF